MSRKAAAMQDFADNFTPVIPMEDDLLHSEEFPFCFDPKCGCHEDQDTITNVAQQVQDGLFTPKEATEFVNGRTM